MLNGESRYCFFERMRYCFNASEQNNCQKLNINFFNLKLTGVRSNFTITAKSHFMSNV